MIKFENTVLPSPEQWKAIIMGARNPMNSWDRSDSYITHIEDPETLETADYQFFIGEKDHELLMKLAKGGSVHAKYRRTIDMFVDITAPLYWWKEFDTYKVSTVANSTSTMHKLMSKPITIDCFEIDDFENIIFPEEFQRAELKYPIDPDVIQMVLIPYLEYLRQQWLKLQELIQLPSGDVEYIKSLEKRAKKIWKELVRWLPEAWLQKRTITMNYENLLGMCSKGQRRFHKLNEWSGVDNPNLTNFISWTRTLLRKRR